MGEVRLEHKHPRAIRWFHWINFPVLTLMIWSGLLIYWAHDVYRVGIGSWTVFHFFPGVVLRHVDGERAAGRGDGLAFSVHVVLPDQRIALRDLYSDFRRVAVSGAEPKFVPRGSAGDALRSASEQSSSAAAEVQWRAADRLYQHHPDGRGIRDYRAWRFTSRCSFPG